MNWSRYWLFVVLPLLVLVLLGCNDSTRNIRAGAPWTAGDITPPVGDTTPPVVTGSDAGNTTPAAGEVILLSVTATDDSGEALTYTWDDGGAGGTFTGTGSSVTWSNDTAGNYTITVTITDASGNETTETFEVTVTEEADTTPPDLGSGISADNTAPDTDEVITLSVTATDDSGGTLTYEWIDNGGGGTFSGTGSSVTWSHAAAGVYTITVTVTDGAGNSSSADIEITVTEPVPEADTWAFYVADATTYGSSGFTGWNDIQGFDLQMTGNPASGGHGPVGSALPLVQMKAVHDGTGFAMRMSWSDDTENSTHNFWTYDAAGGSWSRGGNEDRMYFMWETGDPAVIGRGGDTFSEVGCAMSCHQRLDGGNSPILNTTAELFDCSLCHTDAPGATDAVFEHVETELSCDTCHADYSLNITKADMISPDAAATYDVWHWKAGRSNPLGIAEDQYTPPALRRTRDGSNLAPGNNSITLSDGVTSVPLYVYVDNRADGATAYIFASAIDGALTSDTLAMWNETAEEYQISDGTPFVPADGATVPRAIHNDIDVDTDRSGNLKADGVWEAGVWTVALSRDLAVAETDDNGYPTDKDFFPGMLYSFGIAVTDNSGHNHKGRNLVTIFFEEAP